MRLVWAVPCDSCELHDDGTASIYGAGFDAFEVESLPATVDFTVAVGLLLEEDESSEIEMHIVGPLMSGVRSLSYPVAADPRPTHMAGNYVSQVEAMEVAYPVEASGGYVIEVYNPAPQAVNCSFFFSVVEAV